MKSKLKNNLRFQIFVNLNLEDKKLDLDSIKAINKSIHNDKIIYINLRNNGINKDASFALFHLIVKSKSLASLNLS